MRGAWISILGCLLASGCILEDNPDFVEATEGGTTGPSMGTSGGPGHGTDDVTATGSIDSTGDSTSGSTDSTGGDTGDLPEGPGCDDPSVCTTYHIGPIENSCPHEVDGVATDACDWVGEYALRIATAELEFAGGGGLIVMHNNNVVTSFIGSIDVPRKVTIRAAEGVSPDKLRVHSQDTAGVLRLRGDEIHLQGFTIACRAGGESALTVRADPDTEGTETEGHLIEGLVMVGTRPENVGSNSIIPPIQSLGPDTVVRNNHIWGYFENSVDLRFATNSVISHNTVLYYQSTSSPALDARQVEGLEISNNVFASLTDDIDVFVAADDTTAGLVVVGNAVEGFGSVLGGLEVTDPDVTLDDNTTDPLELESPRSPRVLADSAMAASPMGTREGVSLDGVDLASAAEVLPGAYQVRSMLSLPRRSVITVGDNMCNGSPCDVSKSFVNELQRAAWTAWPGSTVEIYPSNEPYAGPMVISWPIVLRGMGTQPDEVIIRSAFEDTTLDGDGQWSGKDAVLDLTRSMQTPTVVEMLTVEAGPGEIGIFHEGTSGGGLGGRHEIRRVILRDNGQIAGMPADMALYIGDEVVVHDVLIHGGYDTCVRFGPRASESSATPPSTAYVHHLTCRLTEAIPDNYTPPVPAAFEVASAANVVIADIAVEMLEAGPLFRAQRRASGDTDPLMALDPPIDFIAHSIVSLNHSTLYDGFDDTSGIYTLTNIDALLPMDPLFVSLVDSHLADGSVGIDGGVDPSTLEPGLSLGVTVDGIDRTGQVPDRGAYEQQVPPPMLP